MESSCVSVFTRKRLTVTLHANGKAQDYNSSDEEDYERGRQAMGDGRGYEQERAPISPPFSGGRECLNHIYITHLIHSSPLSRPYKSQTYKSLAQNPNGGRIRTMQVLWIFDTSRRVQPPGWVLQREAQVGMVGDLFPLSSRGVVKLKCLSANQGTTSTTASTTA